MVSTASTTMSVSWSASSSYSLVRKEVRAAQRSVSWSVSETSSLKVSRKASVAFLAASKPCREQALLAHSLREQWLCRQAQGAFLTA